MVLDAQMEQSARETARLREQLALAVERRATAELEKDALRAGSAMAEASRSRLEHSLEEASQRATRALASLDKLRREHAALEERLREATVSALASEARAAEAMREQLVRVMCLAARSLAGVAGAASHLALEVAFSQGPRITSVMRGWDLEDDADQLRYDVSRHLEHLGLVRSFSVDAEGHGLRGTLTLPESTQPADGSPMARWVAAYALGCFSENGPTAYHLAALSGGPRDFEWSALPRANSVAAREATAAAAANE
jgi:hypothetical protein